MHMTMLDAKFVENARKEPIEFEHGINVVWFRASDAIAGENGSDSIAVLEVTMDDDVVGYITKTGDDTYGSVPVGEFGGTQPITFRTLEGALEQMLPGVADGLSEKPEL
jgi:hypothetical protein